MKSVFLIAVLLVSTQVFSMDSGKQKKVSKLKKDKRAELEKKMEKEYNPELVTECEYIESCKMCTFQELQQVPECQETGNFMI